MVYDNLKRCQFKISHRTICVPSTWGMSPATKPSQNLKISSIEEANTILPRRDLRDGQICTFWTLQETPWQLSEVGNFGPEFTSTHIKYHQLIRSRGWWKRFLVLCKREAEIEQGISSPSKSLEQELSACKPCLRRYPKGLSQTCWILF